MFLVFVVSHPNRLVCLACQVSKGKVYERHWACSLWAMNTNLKNGRLVDVCVVYKLLDCEEKLFVMDVTCVSSDLNYQLYRLFFGLFKAGKSLFLGYW